MMIASSHDGCIRIDKKTGQGTGDLTQSLGYKMKDKDGVWVEWSYDGQTLELNNDRYGFYPIYYYENDEIIAISNNFSCFSSYDLSLNEDAISFFLRCGYYLGDATQFTEVRAVPPNSTLTYNSKSGVVIKSIVEKNILSDLTYTQAINAYAEVVHQAMLDCLVMSKGKNIIMPLSGGKDSRHILYSLVKHNLSPFECVTQKHVPPNTDDDQYLAEEITKELNLKHTIIPQEQDYFKNILRAYEISNYTSHGHAWILPMVDYITKTPNTVIFDGIVADIFLGNPYYSNYKQSLYDATDYESLANIVIGDSGGDDYFSTILSHDMCSKFSRKKAINQICSELEKHSGNHNSLVRFYFYNRTRRCNAHTLWNLYQKGTVVAPYLHKDVFDLLISLPNNYGEDGKSSKFQVEAMYSLYPDYKRRPFMMSKIKQNKYTFARYAQLIKSHLLFHPGNLMNIKLMLRVMKGLFKTGYRSYVTFLIYKAICIEELNRFLKVTK